MLYSEIILLIPVQIKAIYSQPCFQIALLTKVLHKAQQSVVICFAVAPYMKAILDDISSLDTDVGLFDELISLSWKRLLLKIYMKNLEDASWKFNQIN